MTPYYRDEFVTIYHGDCLEITEWLDAEVLVTDPPYGVDHQPRGSYISSTGKMLPSKLPQIVGDKSTEAREAMLARWGGERPAIIFGSWKARRPANVAHRLIWHKAGMSPGPARAPFMTQDEEIYVIGNGWVASSPPLRSVITTTEHRSTAVIQAGHPTPKPFGLMETLLGRCQPEWSIADPFMGSGATLVAAKRLGRRAVGVEIDERYCELAANSVAQGVLPL